MAPWIARPPGHGLEVEWRHILGAHAGTNRPSHGYEKLWLGHEGRREGERETTAWIQTPASLHRMGTRQEMGGGLSSMDLTSKSQSQGTRQTGSEARIPDYSLNSRIHGHEDGAGGGRYGVLSRLLCCTERPQRVLRRPLSRHILGLTE